MKSLPKSEAKTNNQKLPTKENTSPTSKRTSVGGSSIASAQQTPGKGETNYQERASSNSQIPVEVVIRNPGRQRGEGEGEKLRIQEGPPEIHGNQLPVEAESGNPGRPRGEVETQYGPP